ncbi:hypothetical protein BASA81_008701 [Batrachochytrium salamandrivorans]|nr:hypothetical protein BASA81_008701 [Batrachochytrium salamandrivorans]
MYALNPSPLHHGVAGGQPQVYLPFHPSSSFPLFQQPPQPPQPPSSFLHFYPQSFMFTPPQQQSQFGAFPGFTFNSPPLPSSSSSLFAAPTTSIPHRKLKKAKSPSEPLLSSSPTLELEFPSNPLTLPPPTIHSWQYSTDRIGEYDIPSRIARLERYQAKRRELKFRKVRYAARSEICSQRKRVGGRFVTAAAAVPLAAVEEEDKTVSDEEVSLILQGMKAQA